ncbi:MAG: transcription termination factor NusA [Clostridia bacterium]|nr:transcription termination factor NusA [Clostridia bacterium]
MKNKEFFAAIDAIEKDRGINKERLMAAIEQGLATAYRRNNGEASNVEIKSVPELYKIVFNVYKTVVDEVEDPEKEISLDEALESKRSYKVGDKYYTEIKPFEFSRISAQTAKQIILQSIRDAEKEIVYSQFIQKEGELITGRVCRKKDDGTLFVAIGKDGQTEGILNTSDQNPTEKFSLGDPIKVFVKKVKEGTSGVQVLLSRASAGFVGKLFELEIPEIKANIVQIKGVAREAGYRTKIAVYSTDPGIDAVGACVGQHGARVNSIIAEMSGEKIDIIPWSEDLIDFISYTLSPAKVSWVRLNEETKEATVVVPDDKLSLAIGKEGLNARLAVRLTGCKIDVKKFSDAVLSGMMEEEVNSDRELAEAGANLVMEGGTLVNGEKMPDNPFDILNTSDENEAKEIEHEAEPDNPFDILNTSDENEAKKIEHEAEPDKTEFEDFIFGLEDVKPKDDD